MKVTIRGIEIVQAIGSSAQHRKPCVVSIASARGAVGLTLEVGHSMLDHVGIRTNQLEKLVILYDAALSPLGYTKLFETVQGASFGVGSLPSISIVKMAAPGRGLNLAVRAEDREGVERFYAAAVANGAIGQSPPQVMGQIHADYYTAVVMDPDGNQISAVCHTAQAKHGRTA